INKEDVMWIPVTNAAAKSQKVGWYIKSTISSPNIEEQIYYEMVRLLEAGELPLLRSCPECQRFFVGVDPRRDFCSDQCRHTFNNRPRLESGYFTILRHKKRDRSIQTARRLLREGKTLDAVMKETQLSVRVLERAGLIE